MDSTRFAPGDQPSDLRPLPLQTPFENQAYQQLHHPRPEFSFRDEQPYGDIPREEPYGLRNSHLAAGPDTKAVNLKRRTSRFGLSGLFGRSKSSEHDGKQDRLGIQMEEDEYLEMPKSREDTTSHPIEPISFPDESDALPPVGAPATQSRHRSSKPNLKAKSSFKKEPNSKTWDAPPLFQAYPQAVKHATLRAPCLSAESIVRLNVNNNHNTRVASDPYSQDPAMTIKEKKIRRHNAGIEWTHKIFVLVTSGYFLQYAGDGPFDRLPEKIMPLTKESAAFASDVIPGQPYVLQVSQVSDDKGTLDKDASKSMLKKLGLRNEIRRSTSTFLLVLESAEESSAWLVAVRREIHAMGGKEYKPDEFRKHTIEESIPQLQQKPSQRYLVKRDPNRFSEKPHEPPSSQIWGNDKPVADTPRETVETPAQAAVKRQSLATQTSMESRPLSNTTASLNQVYLDRLRESPRQSYASTAAKTTSTSRGSSPRLSPDQVDIKVPDLFCEFADDRPTPSTYPGSAYTSMHTTSNANTAHRTSMLPYSPQQNAFHTVQHRRTSSPTAPNFSIPTFSKRYSTSPALSSTTSKTQTPPTILHRGPPTPPTNAKENNAMERRTSTIGELQHLRKPSPNTARRISSVENDGLSTPPQSSGSCGPPSSSDGGKRFSRRFSSLEYSRGVSPLQLARQSPSPHPPPTTALPPLPRAASPYRASLIPPPNTALPPIPSASKLPERYSTLPASTASAPTYSVSELSYLVDSSPPPKALPTFLDPEQASLASSATPSVNSAQSVPGEEARFRPSLTHRPTQGPTKVDSIEAQKPHHPVHIEVRSDTVADKPPLQSPQTGIKTTFNLEGLTPPLEDSPPKPTREPPPPPAQQGHGEGRRSVLRTGREPPPVYPPVTNPRPRISVSSRAESYFDGAAPHPFIPPIRVSERKFRGSLDGPWNPSYGAPQRTFLDLSVG